ncbi:MAG: hypothetical protein ABIE14_02455 [Patescibacteria group bacterium]
MTRKERKKPEGDLPAIKITFGTIGGEYSEVSEISRKQIRGDVEMLYQFVDLILEFLEDTNKRREEISKIMIFLKNEKIGLFGNLEDLSKWAALEVENKNPSSSNLCEFGLMKKMGSEDFKY